MAVTANFYELAFNSAFTKQINFTSDTIKVMLCTSAYAPNQGTDQFKSAVTNEVTGTGYAAGGATVATPGLSLNTTTKVLSLTGGNVSWTSSTITARYAVIYDATPATDATRPLIAYVNFGADVSSSGGTFSITWDASGIATVTIS